MTEDKLEKINQLSKLIAKTKEQLQTVKIRTVEINNNTYIRLNFGGGEFTFDSRVFTKESVENIGGYIIDTLQEQLKKLQETFYNL